MDSCNHSWKGIVSIPNCFLKSLYWIRYNIVSVLCFYFWPWGMWDLAPGQGSNPRPLQVLTTKPPEKSLYLTSDHSVPQLLIVINYSGVRDSHNIPLTTPERINQVHSQCWATTSSLYFRNFLSPYKKSHLWDNPPSSPEPLACFLSLWAFWRHHIKGITQRVAFGVWLLAFGILFSRFIRL